jgi:hypothetical protein
MDDFKTLAFEGGVGTQTRKRDLYCRDQVKRMSNTFTLVEDTHTQGRCKMLIKAFAIVVVNCLERRV